MFKSNIIDVAKILEVLILKIYNSNDDILNKVRKIHMIGIGGSGMCPLAQILFSKGYELTGSDNNESNPLKLVKSLGIKVFMGQKAENVHGAELIVYSAAISDDNPEIIEAKKLGIPLMERSALLGAVTRKFDNVIGVCGTHGKTTVSSMITQILYLNNYDPSAVIGGLLPIINSYGRAGESEYMVCESCEFVDTFLQLSPDISVLLNIDNDHLDYFKTMDNLVNSFSKFVNMSKIAVINGDDSLVKSAVVNFDKKVITFGLNKTNDYYATEIESGKNGYKFCVNYNGEKIYIELNTPGRHNVYNALAAFATAHYLGVSGEQIKSAIELFGGAGRRFEKLGVFNGFLLADDYAHHPTEIKATLTAARQLGHKRVIAVFQPFTFSRTEKLKDEFIDALSLADTVILMPIMGSREVNITGISSEDLAKGLKNAICVETFSDVKDAVIKIAKQDDIVITMGGGDIYKAAYMIRDELN